MIIEVHEVPHPLVESSLEAVPAEVNRESVRVWLSTVLTAWENNHRNVFFDKLKGV